MEECEEDAFQLSASTGGYSDSNQDPGKYFEHFKFNKNTKPKIFFPELFVKMEIFHKIMYSLIYIFLFSNSDNIFLFYIFFQNIHQCWQEPFHQSTRNLVKLTLTDKGEFPFLIHLRLFIEFWPVCPTPGWLSNNDITSLLVVNRDFLVLFSIREGLGKDKKKS